MRRPLRWSWTAISIALVAGSAAAEPPVSAFTATYDVARNGASIGRVETSLSRRDDGLWHYRIESEATVWYIRMLGVSATESAWFQWRGGRILPLTYHHVSREPGRDRFWQHEYDWDAGVSRTNTHDGKLLIELQPGTVDPLTLRLAAIRRIADQAPAFASFELGVLERDEIETQQYRFVDRQRIENAGRCYDTAVFERFRKPGSSRNYTAFHARSLDWVPVRIVHEDNGTTMTLTLTDWHGDGASLPAPGDCSDAPEAA